MKKSPSNKSGNKGKQINSLHNQAPDRHDDPQRHQPPTPQDIARVQPISQANHKNHPGKNEDSKNRRGPK